MDTDVLVVGAGPTGLVLASELLRRGLSVRIVDQAAEPSTTSRAIVVHARTLELLDDLGVADELVARGLPLHGVTLRSGGRDVVSASFDELDTRYSFLLSVSQAETEAAFADLLATGGGAVERRKRLVSLRQDGAGVDAVLETPGGPERVRAAWLVGCDGAHSTVRRQLDLPFTGSTYDDRFLLADVRLAWDRPGDRISAFFGDDGLLACFPMRHGRWRLIGTSPPGDTRDEPPTLDELQALFARRTGTDGVLSDGTWLARFRIHCRQVEHYRDDRVFLAGDAAHIHSPAGGQGMNAGIQDAHNLAWKLALVHGGAGRGRLLDSYEAERHAVGRVILRSTDFATRMATLENVVARELRNQVAHFMSGFEFVQRRMVRDVAELALGYPQSPIVRDDHRSVLHARFGAEEAGEAPTVAATRAFEAGPGAGGRAPDGHALRGGERVRLMRVARGEVHTLLLFDGRSPSAAGYLRLAGIAAQVRDRFGDHVRTVLVTPQTSVPPGFPEVLVDAEGELERAYGAPTECLYVIRPDLYVGYRSQPASAAGVLGWLQTVLRPRV